MQCILMLVSGYMYLKIVDFLKDRINNKVNVIFLFYHILRDARFLCFLYNALRKNNALADPFLLTTSRSHHQHATQMRCAHLASFLKRTSSKVNLCHLGDKQDVHTATKCQSLFFKKSEFVINTM